MLPLGQSRDAQEFSAGPETRQSGVSMELVLGLGGLQTPLRDVQTGRGNFRSGIAASSGRHSEDRGLCPMTFLWHLPSRSCPTPGCLANSVT